MAAENTKLVQEKPKRTSQTAVRVLAGSDENTKKLQKHMLSTVEDLPFLSLRDVAAILQAFIFRRKRHRFSATNILQVCASPVSNCLVKGPFGSHFIGDNIEQMMCGAL